MFLTSIYCKLKRFWDYITTKHKKNPSCNHSIRDDSGNYYYCSHDDTYFNFCQNGDESVSH